MSDFGNPEWLVRERRLVAGLRNGDKRCFAELYEAFARPLFQQVLLPELADSQAAYDVLAETFKVVLERLHQYEPREQSMYFWVRRIAQNQAIDWHRRNARTHRALHSFAELLAPILADQDPAKFEDNLAEKVARVLEQLHPRYRDAIEMRFLKEMEREQCAAALSVSISTFDVVLLRALRAFHKTWMEVIGEKPYVK